MKEIGFNSLKIIDTESDNTIGFIDLKIDDETYLSLFMIEDRYRGRKIGKQIYTLLEEYINQFDTSSIRIDVVIGYDDNVLRFWEKNGFYKVEDTILNWNDKSLEALVMNKKLK